MDGMGLKICLCSKSLHLHLDTTVAESSPTLKVGDHTATVGSDALARTCNVEISEPWDVFFVEFCVGYRWFNQQNNGYHQKKTVRHLKIDTWLKGDSY